jgi:hypothetical protein
MAWVLLTRERVLVAMETCLLVVVEQWMPFLGLLFWLSAVMSQYVWRADGHVSLYFT